MKATKATKATNSSITKSNLLSIFARPNGNSCKKLSKANLSKESKSNLNKSNLTKVTKANLSKVNLLSIDSNPTNYKNYSPKIRQQVISNKLLNNQLS